MIITNWEKLIDIICLHVLSLEQVFALKNLHHIVDVFWAEISESVEKMWGLFFQTTAFFLQLIKLFWSYICIFRLEWCAWPYNVHVYYTLIALWLYGLKRVNKIFDPLTKVKSLLGCGFWFVFLLLNSEVLYEDEAFKQRQLSALLASKVYTVN